MDNFYFYLIMFSFLKLCKPAYTRYGQYWHDSLKQICNGICNGTLLKCEKIYTTVLNSSYLDKGGEK